MTETLDQRRERIRDRTRAALSGLDALTETIPEFKRARTRRQLMRELSSESDSRYTDCIYCQLNLGRHSHGFADADGRLSRSESDTRLNARQSAGTWIAAQHWIKHAR